MFLIQYNLLTEGTFNDTIEKVGFVGFGGKNERANFCAVTKNRTKFYVINSSSTSYEIGVRISNCFCK